MYSEISGGNKKLLVLIIVFPINLVIDVLKVKKFTTALLKMGRYSSTTMCQYWGNHLIY